MSSFEWFLARKYFWAQRRSAAAGIIAAAADPQALLRALVEQGVEVQRFELVQPSLHQIFLEKVGATGVEPGMSGHG